MLILYSYKRYKYLIDFFLLPVLFSSSILHHEIQVEANIMRCPDSLIAVKMIDRVDEIRYDLHEKYQPHKSKTVCW